MQRLDMEVVMPEVKCDHYGCKKTIIIDGTGHPFKKVVPGRNGEREVLFFCSAKHLHLDTHLDLNAPVDTEKESM